jgi:sulfite reductase (NADPH) flavoprotein alpha-component
MGKIFRISFSFMFTTLQCREQLEDWHLASKIELITAFSRDQDHKIYVQDRIIENKDSIWALIGSGAHFYVCGDASAMAGQVEAALLQVAQDCGKLDKTGAVAWLESLASTHRYQRDVWF